VLSAVGTGNRDAVASALLGALATVVDGLLNDGYGSAVGTGHRDAVVSALLGALATVVDGLLNGGYLG